MKPDDFFQFHQNGQPSISHQCAILIHRASGITEGGYYGTGQFLASIHDFVTNDKMESVIGAGRLMTQDDVEAVLKSMLDRGQKKVNLLPSNVLAISETHIAWTIPAAVRPMLFHMGMPVKKLSVPWPRLLMVANRDGKLAVAALKTQSRPTGRTRLYRAPLMNVYSGGTVCTGSAPVPAQCHVDQLSAWEAVMFDSAFSHVNNPSTLALDRKKQDVDNKAHYQFWASLSKTKAEKFPNDRLVPMSVSVEEFIARNA